MAAGAEIARKCMVRCCVPSAGVCKEPWKWWHGMCFIGTKIHLLYSAFHTRIFTWLRKNGLAWCSFCCKPSEGSKPPVREVRSRCILAVYGCSSPSMSCTVVCEWGNGARMLLSCWTHEEAASCVGVFSSWVVFVSYIHSLKSHSGSETLHGVQKLMLKV